MFPPSHLTLHPTPLGCHSTNLSSMCYSNFPLAIYFTNPISSCTLSTLLEFIIVLEFIIILEFILIIVVLNFHSLIILTYQLYQNLVVLLTWSLKIKTVFSTLLYVLYFFLVTWMQCIGLENFCK